MSMKPLFSLGAYAMWPTLSNKQDQVVKDDIYMVFYQV